MEEKECPRRWSKQGGEGVHHSHVGCHRECVDMMVFFSWSMNGVLCSAFR